MKRFIKIFFLALVCLFVLLLVLLVDLSPTVGKHAHKQVENAENVTDLIYQLRKSFRNRYQPQQIDITYSQAESLLGFSQRALPNVSSDLRLSETNAEILVSYQLPAYLFSTYINASIRVNEGSKLDIDSVTVGLITIPGTWALTLAESLVNSYTKSEVASKAIELIAKTEISIDHVIINLKPLDTFLRELKNVNTSGEAEQRQILRTKTVHYLRLLEGLSDQTHSDRKNKDTPLSFYLNKIMIEAKAISTKEIQGNINSAALENEAAIIALAIYAGHRRFSTLFGDLSFALDSIPTADSKPVLANRKDLSLHFIFSAAIKLLSEQGISIAVGEFKELMDRGKGGSGYSFVDLTADMAGAHFATLAVDPISAEHLQHILSMEENENLFFPSIEGLEEGINKSEFKQRYKDIESDQYLEVVQEIEKRINQLPINNLQN
ncbi:hypothetical protein [Glaciecola sp. MF2-115]|uniref:hypothetical protein n=1 Tax=Glaciecola sp. MF2-115 TaxID=3384827 RepID=UPI0039A0A3E1